MQLQLFRIDCRFGASVAPLLLLWSACSVYDSSQLSPHKSGPTRPASGLLPIGGRSGAFVSFSPRASAPSQQIQSGAPAVSEGGSITTAPETQPGGDKACEQQDRTDFCATLPWLRASPIIDGKLDCGLGLTPIAANTWNGAGPAPATRVEYAAAWRDDGFYAYVKVIGTPGRPHPAEEPAYCGDAVEIYVNGARGDRGEDAGTYEPEGTMQFVIAAPDATAPMEHVDSWRFNQGNPHGAWVTSNVRTSPVADGYSVEAFITAADVGLWAWSPRAGLTFNLAIDVSGDVASGTARCGTAVGQLFLRLAPHTAQCPGEPWCDVRAFCSPSLRQ